MSAIKFVTLTPEQRASHNQKASAWIDSLIVQARDDSDPEMRDNARTILDFRGIDYS